MSECPLICTYDCCLNRGGGTPLSGLGRAAAPSLACQRLIERLYHRRRKLAAKVKRITEARRGL